MWCENKETGINGRDFVVEGELVDWASLIFTNLRPGQRDSDPENRSESSRSVLDILSTGTRSPSIHTCACNDACQPITYLMSCVNTHPARHVSPPSLPIRHPQNNAPNPSRISPSLIPALSHHLLLFPISPSPFPLRPRISSPSALTPPRCAEQPSPSPSPPPARPPAC